MSENGYEDDVVLSQYVLESGDGLLPEVELSSEQEHFCDIEMSPAYATKPWNHPSVTHDEVGKPLRRGERKVDNRPTFVDKFYVPQSFLDKYDVIRRALELKYGGLPEDIIGLSPELNALERRFVIEYSQCFQVSKTMQRIFGDSENKTYVNAVGQKLFSNPLVRSEIDRISAEAATYLDISSMRVLLQVAQIAFADISDYTNWDGNSASPKSQAELAAAGIDTGPIEKIVFRSNKNGDTFELKMYNKMEALGMLAKIFKMVPEQVDVNAKVEQQVIYANASESLVSKLAELAQRNRETRDTLNILPAGTDGSLQ